MAVKVPIRTVFDGSTATGLAEYQSGEFIGLTHGGLGASLSIGSAGQVLKVNSGGSALEFGTAAVAAAQTTITSILATDLIIGEDAQTAIDFGTANEIDFKVDNAARLTLTSSALFPVTDNQIDLGTSSLEFKDAFFDGTVTSDAFAGPLTGDVTGTASIATNVTVADESSDTTCFPTFVTAATGNLPPKSGSNLTFNSSSGLLTATLLAGALTGDVTGNADTATLATTVVITDNEDTNENNAIIFTAGGDLDGGNLGLESDGDLYYNPSTGTLTVSNISVSGTFSTVNSVTMDANNAVIFEGTTADAHETTLTSIDATGDRTISLPNVSGTLPVLAAVSTTAISSTPEELNILDGATVVVGEINALDLGSTAVGTAIASKAVILDSNKDYTGIRDLTLAGDIIIADAGTIGTATTAGAIAIAADGTVDLDVAGATVASAVIKTVGKESIWVPASAMQPTTSNGCSALTTVETTSGRPDMVVLDFAVDADSFAQFSIAFPKSYNLGTITFQCWWSGIAATTDVDWSLDAVAMNDNETIDVAFGTAVVVEDSAQGAVEELNITVESGAVTIAGTPADNDLCFFRIGRDVSGGNMDGAARLHGMKIFFTTDATNDA
jgi:hypothetical protein